ncbi:hypothetical protein [Thermosediminibacter litoriperuensis]|uniref:Uncharacterized protein n=1 Tax=Thermosediminibacter litoriperuensis TaxID=291989 RepID=A0A5S5AVI2_9FIRM|nr:hypothetical protein [Thermosediminibacter litoriperuensis]TYP56118.1 hypothetical protein LZ11_01039 [Thermosediminibacter litoriperuensis]
MMAPRNFRPFIVFLAGVVTRLLLYGSVSHRWQWNLQRTVLARSVAFVKAEYSNDRRTLLEMANGPLESEIRKGLFRISS